MTWLDTTIVGAVIIIGLFLMYRALKEPLDLLFGLIWTGLVNIKNWILGTIQDDSGGRTIIKYE